LTADFATGAVLASLFVAHTRPRYSMMAVLGMA